MLLVFLKILNRIPIPPRYLGLSPWDVVQLDVLLKQSGEEKCNGGRILFP